MRNLIKFFVIVLGILFINISLVGAESIKDNRISGGVSWSSPFYEDGNKSYSSNDSSDTLYVEASTEEELKETVLANVQEMKESFFIHYTGDASKLSNLLKDILDGCYDYSGYNTCLIKRWECSYNGYENNIIITFDVQYIETKEQFELVDKKVREILSTLITADMNEFKKEKVIHDYIVKNVAYDETEDKHSDYDALFYGKTVCQGYALLNYKMLTIAGIKVRIVTGTAGKDVPHAWNMVNIKDSWYQVDCTWDDPVPDVQGRVKRDFFNVTDSFIGKNHSWDKSKYEPCIEVFQADRVNAPMFEPEGSYKVVKDIKDVYADKRFTVKFSKELDKDGLSKDSIELIQGYDSRSVAIKVENLGSNIIIIPEEKLKPCTKYYIIINNGIRAADKSKLDGSALIKIETSL